MIKHYLKVAFRNLRKYKSQTLISVVGLAVGFTCFALASLWIRYEMTYDDFHRDADRIYRVCDEKYTTSTWFLARFLKNDFPEIEIAADMEMRRDVPLLLDGTIRKVTTASVNSATMKMFDIRLIEGNLDFLVPNSKKIAITEEESKALFGDKSPLGETIRLLFGENTICAVVSGWSKHSNIYYQFLIATIDESQYAYMGWDTFIKLNENTDVKRFAEKLYSHKIEFAQSGGIDGYKMTPLKSWRYTDSNIKMEVNFQYLRLFAGVGLLVIVCSLFSYISLFVSRFRMRQKELGLRMVLGASGKNLFVQFVVEYLLVLGLSLLLGSALIRLSLPVFWEMSGIIPGVWGIYWETLLYCAGIIALSVLVFYIVIHLFRRYSLDASIRRRNKNAWRNASIIIQLIISVGFIFCTVVMMKQIYFMQKVDLGADFRHTAFLDISPKQDTKVMVNQLKQIPEVKEAINGSLMMISWKHISNIIKHSEDFPAAIPEEGIEINLMPMSEDNLRFFNMRLLSGEWITGKDPFENILINEAAAKAFGWENPVGQSFEYSLMNSNPEEEKVRLLIKGVLKDVNVSPVTRPVPTIFILENRRQLRPASDYVMFRFQEGKWNTVKEKIEAWLQKTAPNSFVLLRNSDDEYNEFMKSETALLKLLTFVSFVCVVISIFGFFSLISLSCEERRKEIAIRKINGATMQNILAMFFKTYFTLLLAGTVITFPIVYYIMKQWLEKYVERTSVGVWIYPSIILALTSVIALCVGWRVYRASVENPAEEITKS